MEKVQFNNLIINKILKYYEKLWSIDHVVSVVRWDLRICMPDSGNEARSKALAKMSTFRKEKFMNQEFTDLIKKSNEETDLNDYEKAVVRVLSRSLDFYEKVPEKLIEQEEETVTKAHASWKKAREEKDFGVLQSDLEKLVDLARQKADYLGYEEHPYDPLLDRFEENLTTKQVEQFFTSIKKPLLKIYSKAKSNSEIYEKHELEEVAYSRTEMEKLNQKLLDFFKVDRMRFRDDEAVHPFTTSIDINDVRISTRYNEKNFKRSFLPTVHEFGHALHGLQCNPALAVTPIRGHGTSIGESQSRFFEILISRSRAFLIKFLEDMKNLSPEIQNYIEKNSIEGIYKYFNTVRPSLIRVEADEITYHFHILLRFEIEKELIAGNIKVEELPEIWNSKMKEYLGIVPPNDSLGVLQDVHWSSGYFGYFPTYSMGTFISQMWSVKMQEEIGSIEDLLSEDDGIKKIKKWLGDNIHQYGDTYTMNELIKKVVGSKLNPQPMLDYLENKYVKL